MASAFLTVAAVATVFPFAELAQSDRRPVSWEIENREGFGFVTTIARCNDVLVLADVRRNVIHRYDIAGRQLLTEFGPTEGHQLLSVVADCPTATLYMLTVTANGMGSVVKRINFDSGAQSADFRLPATFVPRSAAWTESGELFIGGLWGLPAPDESPGTYYEGRSIGLRLVIATGATEPVLAPYEIGCVGGPSCSQVRVHGLSGSDGPRRVAALPASTAVGVYDDNKLRRVVPVVSPRLFRDRTELPLDASGQTFLQWTEANATLDGVFAFANGFAVEHRSSALNGWQPGTPIPKRVHVNTYGWDGDAKRVDIPLPGPVVGHGDGRLYAIDDSDGSHMGAMRIRVAVVLLDELR